MPSAKDVFNILANASRSPKAATPATTSAPNSPPPGGQNTTPPTQQIHTPDGSRLFEAGREAIAPPDLTPSTSVDPREDMAWAQRFHTAMLEVIEEEHGKPQPKDGNAFLPQDGFEHVDILAITRGIC